MSFTTLDCPHCHSPVRAYHNPIPTVDIIIEVPGGIVLILRRNEPLGWALPGGFVDYGETLEQAAIREAKEETGLTIQSLRLLGCYSDPARDSRLHTISTVFVASGLGTPKAADDAADLAVFALDNLPPTLCFDHGAILADYLAARASRSS
jgi:8-oxo-dGTP diphosphatase